MDYTAEDDELLVQYLAVVTPTINGRQSKTLYNQLFASVSKRFRPRTSSTLLGSRFSHI